MNSGFLPKIDHANCIGCELCVKLCPNQVLIMNRQTATLGTPEACNYTGACQAICPTQAISLAYEIVFHQKKKGGNS